MEASHLDNYRVIRQIGIGSFGKVKLAIHIPTNRKVAVKVLDKSLLKKMRAQDKVLRELEILRMCRSPHVVKLLEVQCTANKYFIVMEYMSGGDLYTLLERKVKIKESEARTLLQQIVAGLAHCLSLNICHRDIKLENLLLDSDNNVKICDFGFARVCPDGDFCKTMCGTPNYCAPEVLANENYYGSASDIWSLGVVLYALLVGRLPFEDVNVSSLYAKASKGSYSEPRHVSNSVKHLIRQMLDPNPATRITLDEVQAHAWFKRKLPFYIKQHLVIKEDIDETAVEKCKALKYFSSRDDNQVLADQIIKKQGSFYISYELLRTEQDRALITEARTSVKTESADRSGSYSSTPLKPIARRSQANTPRDWMYGLNILRSAMGDLVPLMTRLGVSLQRLSKNKLAAKAATYKHETALYTTANDYVIDFKFTEGNLMHFLDHASSVVASTMSEAEPSPTLSARKGDRLRS
mmetsp:Transcript_15709/g.28688  ORF Transcript_15709/g.28688 Transcript_15709/m.28688 type:complete len:466 (+) Transcript_15709:4590-5987(+)